MKAILSTFLLHFEVLTLKNFRVLRRHYASAVFRVLAPTVMLLLVLIIKDAVTKADDWSGKVASSPPDQINVDSLPRGDVYGYDNVDDNYYSLQRSATTLAYAPRDEFTDSVMANVAKANGLKLGKDIVGFASRDDIVSQLFNAPGSIRAASVFDPPSAGGGQQYSYELIVNITASTMTTNQIRKRLKIFPEGRGGTAVEGAPFAKAIDEAIASAARAAKGLPTDPIVRRPVGLSYVPVHPDRVEWDRSDSVSSSPPPIVPGTAVPFLSLAASVVAIFAASAAVEEKRRGLLGALRRLGLSEFAYWAAWMVPMMAFALVASLLYTVVGVITGMQVFTECDFTVHVVLMFLFLSAMSAMGLLIAATFTSPMVVNLVCTVVFIAIILQQSIFAGIGNDGRVSDEFPAYAVKWDSVQGLSSIATFLVELCPWHNFGRAFNTIIEVTLYEHKVFANKDFSARYTWALAGKSKNYTALMEEAWTRHAPGQAFDCVGQYYGHHYWQCKGVYYLRGAAGGPDTVIDPSKDRNRFEDLWTAGLVYQGFEALYNTHSVSGARRET
mmetsp:Transcript_16747/g.52879  ORF Transcript_16747/g.52879 Transcript_16747/m.52879 type:complete len:556 (-) Transcript_16747:757-2424(-)